jgi:hypothetical protein
MRALVLLAPLLLWPASASTIEAGGRPELICYCRSEGPAPKGVVELDTNLDILLACQKGCTEDDLEKARILGARSQLVLLQAMRLLRNRDGKWTTAIPILDRAQTDKLRSTVRRDAAAFLQSAGKDLFAFLETLRREGREEILYTLLFSYVLDHLAWREMQLLGFVRAPESFATSAKEPFWNGIYWGVDPTGRFRIGTNQAEDHGWSLMIPWNPNATSRLGPFMNWDKVNRLIAELAAGGQVKNSQLRADFAEYGILDGKGRPILLVIQEKEGNGVFGHAQQAARSIAKWFAAYARGRPLKRELGAETDEAGAVIAYHEWMWQVLSLLEERRIISKPKIFADPSQATPSDAGRIVFVLRP